MSVYLFTDIEGSAKKWEFFGEVMPGVQAQHAEITRSVVEQFDGKVVKGGRDGVLAIFENRAALKCALKMQEEMSKPIWDNISGLKARVALHEGKAKKKDGDYSGPVINSLSGLLTASWGGQIVLTAEVLEESDAPEAAVIEPLGTHLFKDLYNPLDVLEMMPKSRKETFAPLRSLNSIPNNLPAQSTPFLGREEALKQVDAVIKDPACRMISLVGQGGVGKTRLGLQAAAARVDDFSQGIYFVSLVSVNDRDGLISTIAEAVHCFFSGDLSADQQLLRFLKEQSMMLILDNVERLSGSAFVGEILNAALKLKILATSRSRLNLPEEKVVPVEGLSCPPKDGNMAWDQFEAGRFFVACAQRLRADFAPKDTEGEDITHICSLLEGVPLAIELAAAWVKMLSCREIREEIEISFDFLESKQEGVPERHQSLRSVFEYSWNALTTDEKKALLGISVFQGGFLAEAGQRVADCSPALLSVFIDKSLLRQSHSNRFEMHELIRQFSEEKLKGWPEVYESVRELHSDYFCDLLTDSEAGLKSQAGEATLQAIGDDIRNVMTAWRWAVKKQNVRKIGSAYNALFNYFEIKFLAKEGEDAFALAAAAFSDPDVAETPDRKVLFASMQAREGWFCYQQGRVIKAEMMIKQSLVILRELHRDKEVGECLHFLCPIYSFLRKYDAEEACAKESWEIFRKMNDDWCTAWSLFHLAQRPKQNHENEIARKYFLESAELFRKMGYRDGLAWNLTSLGQIAMLERDFVSAEKYFNESLAIFERRENKISAGMILLELTHLREDMEDHETAYALAKRAHAFFVTSNNRLRLAWANFYCADSAFNMGKWQESLTASDEALRLFSEEEDQVGQGWTYANFCRANNEKGQFEEARVHGKKGVDVFVKINDREGVGACESYLGFSEMGLGHFAEAQQLFLSSLENVMSRKIYWRAMNIIFGLAVLKTKVNDMPFAFLLATVLMKDPTIGKELKTKTADFISQIEPSLSSPQIKEAQEKAKTFTTQTLAVYLREAHDDKVKSPV